jgi:hypothetical protein
MTSLLDRGSDLLDNVVGEVGRREHVIDFATLHGVDRADPNSVSIHAAVVPGELGVDGPFLEVNHLPGGTGVRVVFILWISISNVSDYSSWLSGADAELQAALDAADPSEKNYHIREALQKVTVKKRTLMSEDV